MFDNGVDENCDGRDNPNLDRDADGFAQPGDCDDDNAAVKPGALEVRGNAVDENCDRRAEPFAQLGAVVSNQWLVTRTHAKLLSLVVRLAPKGARIVLTCKGKGCPKKRTQRRTVSRDLQRIVLQRAVPALAPALRHAADAHHHRRGDDRAHVLLRGQARRAAAADDHLPRAGRVEGALVLRLVACAVVCAGLLLPATASAGTFGVSGTTIVYDGEAGRRPDRGLRHGHQHPPHPLRRRRRWAPGRSAS